MNIFIKNLLYLILVLVIAGAIWFGFSNNKVVSPQKTASECEIPAFAKAIGHEDKWLLHNGCPPIDKAKK